MPLSEHEQRLLSQMEQQLLADDPRFASAMRGARRGASGRRMVIGGVAVVVGLLLLVLAVANGIIPLGVGAFVLMLAGAAYALSAPKKGHGPIGVVGADGRTQPVHPAKGRRGSSGTSGTFMQRMEHRWHRRRDER